MNKIILSRADGYLYDALHFDAVDMPIEHIAHNLAYINRYNGAQPEPVSVGLHSILVSYLVPDMYAYEALMHDATEAIVGDVAHPIKALCADFRHIEACVHAQLQVHYNLPAHEALVVKEADVRARVLECAYRRGGELTMCLKEIGACQTWLEQTFDPDEVASLFLQRYEDSRQLALQWH